MLSAVTKELLNAPECLLPGLGDLMPLAAAARRLPESPHPKTLSRWALKGVGGVHLRTIKMGRRLLTTEKWLVEFAAAIANPRPRSAAPARSPSRQRRTEKLLREARS